MAANIRVTLRDSPGGSVVGSVTAGTSREDLVEGYEVEVYSSDAATTYLWSLEYTPDSPGGTANAAVLSSTTARTALFDVSYEGSYLVKLIVDQGLGGEDEQTVRLRQPSYFAELKPPAAGERKDVTGTVPEDATITGWSDDQNENILKLMLMVRRVSTSGRLLYVDANKGRDASQLANDDTNTFTLPGALVNIPEASGLVTKARGFGEFSTITEAIAWAVGAAGRGEPALSATEPYFIIVQTGLYVEDLEIPESIILVGLGGYSRASYVQGVGVSTEGGVVIRPATVAGHVYETGTPNGGSVLINLTFHNTIASANPLFSLVDGTLIAHDCAFAQEGNATNQGPAFGMIEMAPSASARIVEMTGCTVVSGADNDVGRAAMIIDAPAGQANLIECELQADQSCLLLNENLYENGSVELVRCTVSAVDGYGIRGYPEQLSLRDTFVAANTPNWGMVIDNFGSGTKTGDVSIYMEHCTLQRCNLVLNADDLSGTFEVWPSSLVFGGSAGNDQNSIQNVGAAAISLGGNTTGYSVGYVRDLTQVNTGALKVFVEAQLLSSEINVQDALDALAVRLGGSRMAYQTTATSVNMTFGGVLAVNTSGGAYTIGLPTVVEAGTQVVVKDITGDAGANNITVEGQGGDLIDGVANVLVAANYGSVRVFFDGTNWNRI